MSSDYRALCEELIDALESNHQTWRIPVSPLIARARATLAAEAVAEGPTDEELDRLERQHWEETGVEEQGQRETLFNHRSFARAVLARYGHPAPAPAGEVGEAAHIRRMCDIILGNTFGNEELDSLALLVGHHADVLNAAPPVEGEVVDEARYLAKELRDQADDLSPSLELFGLIHRAAELLEQRHPVPVSVTERLPRPEDCDAEGSCWVYQLHEVCPECPDWELRRAKYASLMYGATHWLPATALPLPADEVRP